jgi:hypothetical protein
VAGDPPAALASAADLSGNDLGGGRVSLRWTHPLDPATHDVRFDVYSATDPLGPFRALRLEGHPSTKAELAGFEQGGDVWFTVVARRGAVTALPCRPLRLASRSGSTAPARSSPRAATSSCGGGSCSCCSPPRASGSTCPSTARA